MKALTPQAQVEVDYALEHDLPIPCRELAPKEHWPNPHWWRAISASPLVRAMKAEFDRLLREMLDRAEIGPLVQVRPAELDDFAELVLPRRPVPNLVDFSIVQRPIRLEVDSVMFDGLRYSVLTESKD